MEIQGYLVPEDLYYDRNHSWARVEGEEVVVGLTDFAQKLAGEFIHIALPRVGRQAQQGKPMASVESGKWVGRVYAPVSGEILEVNEELEEDTTLLNRDPYGQGWIARIRLADPGELAALMQGEAVAGFLAEEIAKHQ
ncbi:MAG TPA: glycine cleavage system protein H [Firmicutes bacterium]|nr:glycine cleavage system protein H [Bacillota bacterium]